LARKLKKKNGDPTRASVLRILQRNLDKIREFGVSRIGLFGSLNRGRFRKGSDIDLLVTFHPGQETFHNLMGLHQLLIRLLGRRIDLVTSGGLSPYLTPYVLNEIRYVEESNK